MEVRQFIFTEQQMISWNKLNKELRHIKQSMKIVKSKHLINKAAFIDTKLVKTILLLNAKGYKTKNCCSGHRLKKYSHLNHKAICGYISFTSETGKLPLRTIRKIVTLRKFRSEYNPTHYGIYWSAKNQKQLKEYLASIEDWANSLPVLIRK